MDKIILLLYSTPSKMRRVLKAVNIFAAISSLLLMLSLPAQASEKKLSGEQAFKKYCALCHQKEKQTAPQLDDKHKHYWQTKFRKGLDQGFLFVTNPKQHHMVCKDCYDSAIKEAIKYIAVKSGASNSTLW